MAKRATDEDRDLLDELGVETESAPTIGRTPKEQRIIAGFEEIERWMEEHGRAPRHGEDRDIFERLYALRLDRLRASVECRVVLEGLDSSGLLGESQEPADEQVEEGPADDIALLESLGIAKDGAGDLGELVHVRSREEIKAAEEVAQRNPCADFALFKPVFEVVQRELAVGARRTIKYQDNAEVNQGDLFILDGQKVLVADLGEPFVSDYGRPDRRLRVVYDNGTESDLLVRSLQRALNKDKLSRRITQPDLGPLFSEPTEGRDVASGTIYVLRSMSDHPFVAKHRDVLHKIGVTGADVKCRVANAKKDPTYLLADVEIVATFRLVHLDRKRVEALLHKFFGAARLDLELKDRFGSHVEPREWFLVGRPVIEQAISLLDSGEITKFYYDTVSAKIVPL